MRESFTIARAAGSAVTGTDAEETKVGVVEVVGVVVGVLGVGALAELVRRSLAGGRFERSLVAATVRVVDERSGHRPPV